jgi:hypothetical protein
MSARRKQPLHLTGFVRQRARRVWIGTHSAARGLIFALCNGRLRRLYIGLGRFRFRLPSLMEFVAELVV